MISPRISVMCFLFCLFFPLLMTTPSTGFSIEELFEMFETVMQFGKGWLMYSLVPDFQPLTSNFPHIVFKIKSH